MIISPKKRYSNLPGSPPRHQDKLKWIKFIFKALTSKTPATPTDIVHPRTQVLRDYQKLAAVDTLTWLGHAAFLIKLEGKTILLDPFLSEYASPIPGLGPKRYTPPGMIVDDLPPIDILVVSHNHYDHLDAKTIASLPNKDTMQVIVPLSLGAFFKSYGYKHIRELDWYQSWSWQEITIRALPAYHFSKRVFMRKNSTLWASFAISSKKKNIYFGGDSAYGPVFSELGAKYGLFDYALLGIGAYAPNELLKSAHITPEEAIKISMELRAKIAVAMHWGTLILSEEPPMEPPVRFKKAAADAGIEDTNTWVMKIGETKAL